MQVSSRRWLSARVGIRQPDHIGSQSVRKSFCPGQLAQVHCPVRVVPTGIGDEEPTVLEGRWDVEPKALLGGFAGGPQLFNLGSDYNLLHLQQPNV